MDPAITSTEAWGELASAFVVGLDKRSLDEVVASGPLAVDVAGSERAWAAAALLAQTSRTRAVFGHHDPDDVLPAYAARPDEGDDPPTASARWGDIMAQAVAENAHGAVGWGLEGLVRAGQRLPDRLLRPVARAVLLNQAATRRARVSLSAALGPTGRWLVTLEPTLRGRLTHDDETDTTEPVRERILRLAEASTAPERGRALDLLEQHAMALARSGDAEIDQALTARTGDKVTSLARRARQLADSYPGTERGQAWDEAARTRLATLKGKDVGILFLDAIATRPTSGWPALVGASALEIAQANRFMAGPLLAAAQFEGEDRLVEELLPFLVHRPDMVPYVRDVPHAAQPTWLQGVRPEVRPMLLRAWSSWAPALLPGLLDALVTEDTPDAERLGIAEGVVTCLTPSGPDDLTRAVEALRAGVQTLKLPSRTETAYLKAARSLSYVQRMEEELHR